MNNLYRLRRLWPIIHDTSEYLSLFQKKISFKKFQVLQTCSYCKKYGLYDEENDEVFGEFNKRGAYINHRAERPEGLNRNFRGRGIDIDEDDDDDDDYEAPRRNKFSQNRHGGGNFRQRSNRNFRGNDFDEDDEGEYDASQRNKFSQFRHEGNNFRERSNNFQRFQNDSYNRDNNSFYQGKRNNDSFYQRNSGFGGKRAPVNLKDLPAVEKNFYQEHEAVAGRSMDEVDTYRQSVDITIKGSNVPKPITNFDELCIPGPLMQAVMQEKFNEPTPIQCQGWPIALSGRDMIGISQTGSGKTLVFALPAMVHIMNQAKVAPSSHENFPQGLVLAPTRELAQQIHEVSHKFQHICGIHSACVYGGAAKGPQLAKLRSAQMCIATPGRLIDFVQEGSINLSHCSYLVLDEADRMLDMGFEPQIRQIIERIRPDRQTLMWSATWPEEIQTLAEDFLSDYIQVTIGSEDLTANPNIEQNIYIVGSHEKTERLTQLLKAIKSEENCKTLVFAQTKKTVDYLSRSLNQNGILAMSIHGDVSQMGRNRVIQSFRNQPKAVLVATDVAARGLDITDIHHVVNFDFPTNIEDYIHRIGRTARGFKTGTAHSFFTHEDAGVAKKLVDVLKEVGQEPSAELMSMVQRRPSPNKRGYFSGNRGRYGGDRNNY